MTSQERIVFLDIMKESNDKEWNCIGGDTIGYTREVLFISSRHSSYTTNLSHFVD